MICVPKKASNFQSRGIKSCGGEVIGAFLRGQVAKGVGDGLPEVEDGSRGGVALQGLELGEGHFDGIEVGTVRRQESKARDGGLITCLTPWTILGLLWLLAWCCGRQRVLALSSRDEIR
jgi:hypothetical protein